MPVVVMTADLQPAAKAWDAADSRLNAVYGNVRESSRRPMFSAIGMQTVRRSAVCMQAVLHRGLSI